MTLMRRVVSSDFFAINLTPEEARPGTEPPRRVLEFLSTHCDLRKRKDAGITSSWKTRRDTELLL